MRSEDAVRRYVLEKYNKGDQFFAKDVAEATNVTLCVVCNMLREMKEESILSRRRNAQKWEYFLTDPHDPDEYIEDKKAGVILAKKYASLHGNLKKVQLQVERLKALSREHDLHIGCECGRRFSVRISVEAIKDDDPS